MGSSSFFLPDDYLTVLSWAVFVSIFTITALYATRKKWEPWARANLPIYSFFVPLQPHVRGRAGAGYLPGNSSTGALPRSSLLPTSSSSSSTSNNVPLSSFESDIASGLTSENFNLQTNNLALGDSRQGLAEDSKLEIQTIMREKHVGFDQARQIYTARVLERNNIGPDGRPRDPRAVFFS
ncbi:hypothetical protein V1514DRAFT_337771 [Lipomyces japonicus]|uniref:uncharacterized protein n=1 Tax=Lipomyces japonicus TaxID=56871 RepID=UPI0034CD11D8